MMCSIYRTCHLFKFNMEDIGDFFSQEFIYIYTVNLHLFYPFRTLGEGGMGRCH